MIQKIVKEEHDNKRIEYIDAIRGMAMLLVVYCHVINGVLDTNSDFSDICVKFRMPLFFFISGFLSYTEHFTLVKFKKRSYNRVFGQFMPTIVVCCIYAYVSNIGWNTIFFDPTKYGYWFTIAMFEVYIFYAIISLVITKFNLSANKQLIVYLLVLVLSHLTISLLVRLDYPVLTTDFWKLTSLGQGILYTKYFIFGVICKLLNKKFIYLIENQYFVAVSILLFVFFYYFQMSIISTIQGFLGIIIIFALFHHFRDIFSKKTIVGRILSYIGKKTLEIYLIHFILLLGISGLKNIPSLISLIQNNILIEIFIVSLISILIIGLCLIIAGFFKISPILYKVLFGFKK